MLTREEWLQEVTARIRPWFLAHGHPLPEVRVSVGFPSHGMRSKAIGECWSGACADDGLSQVFIHPSRKDTLEVSAILGHELIHAAVGLKCKHRGAFSKVATAMGLNGPMTATTAGDGFKTMVEPIILELGEYPHAGLHGASSSIGKKQTTRLLKASCHSCGYTVRVSGKWLDMGYPICPCCQESMQ